MNIAAKNLIFEKRRIKRLTAAEKTCYTLTENKNLNRKILSDGERAE